MTKKTTVNRIKPKRRLPSIVSGVLIAGLATVGVWYVWSGRRDAVHHVIFISLDTVRADHLACYGNTWIKTPALDALADESIVLADYMTAASTTLASHTSLFTGKYPHTHGVPRNGFVVSDDNVMLPEILNKAGFKTAGFLGSFALDRRFNFAQGFDHYDQEFDIHFDGKQIDQNQRRAATVTDAVLDYLDREDVPPRMFLFVHYFDAHHPYDPPAPYDTMYGDTPGAIEFENHPAFLKGELSPASRQALANYAGEISYMDEQIGRLIDELRRRGILDRALLVITSDHGENPEDLRGLNYHHGRTVYQAEMHCVGMIRFPHARHGGVRFDAPISSVDIMPTVLNILGQPIPSGVAGVAWDFESPVRDSSERPRFGEATKPQRWESDSGWNNVAKPRCVRLGPYKFIRTLFRNTRELYNVREDPHERYNLLESPPSEIVALSADLERKLDEWAATANPLPSHFDKKRLEDTIARLKALGYLGEDDEIDEEEETP